LENARDYILLYVNGQRHEIRGPRAFQSLSDFLRYDLVLTGTKVVCAEGDCGSCTILLGRVASDSDDIRYETVCSCIQFLYQLDATHIITIEGLKYDGKLNPVQEAMVQFQGTQCGFCTPGFVMSLCAMFEKSGRAVSAKDAAKACVGNLCRCTGYLPILEAASGVDATKLRPITQLYPPGDLVKDLRQQEQLPVSIRADNRRYFKPVKVEQAAKFSAENPGCLVIAGGTDIGVQINKGIRDPQVVMSLSGLRELEDVRVENSTILAGAKASIAALEKITAEALPEYSHLLYYFGSPPIKNAGTVGGNIVNGSPIGDTMPAMFVLNAEIELASPTARRRVNINDFYTGYRKTVMQADELLTRVIVPLPAHDELFKVYKVSRRKDLDISAFTAAIWMRREGELITDARIAFGGVGPVILRLPKTEDFFRGKALTETVVREAGRIARSEITPISDVRGSADYRSQLGENIFRKMYADLTQPGPNGNGNGNGSNGDGQPRGMGPAPGAREPTPMRMGETPMPR
jgi:xanthine dehydrogenase small subunit